MDTVDSMEGLIWSIFGSSSSFFVSLSLWYVSSGPYFLVAPHAVL